jgi:hypothetical protein
MEAPHTLEVCSSSDMAVVDEMPSTIVVGVAVG